MKNEAYLRLATEDDMELLFEWVNEENVRKNSFSSNPISYEEHQEWFHRVINDKKEKMFIFYYREQPVGQVRASIEDSIAVVGYSIAVQYRMQGYGKMMLLLLEKSLKDICPNVVKISAEVKPDNVASIKVFEQLDYSERCLVFEKNISCVTEDKSR